MRPETNAAGEREASPERARADAWVARLRERGERLVERGIDYVHLVVPDAAGASSRRALVAAGAATLPGVLGLDDAPAPTTFDEALARAETAIAGALGLDGAAAKSASERRASRRYANRLVRHAEAFARPGDPGPSLGAHVIYENVAPEAAGLRVVLFGGEFAHYGPHRLSGRLAERVRELHFVWSADLDCDYIAQVRPDAVVTVLAADAMERVPHDAFDLGRVAAERLAAARTATRDAAREGTRSAVGTTGDRSSPVHRRRVLECESYRLDPPVVTQPGRDPSLHEPLMRGPEVERIEVTDARVHFDGLHALVLGADGETTLRRNVDASRFTRARDEQYRPLAGRTLLLGDSSEAHRYSHWMTDILPRLGLLEREGIALDSIDTFLVRELVADFQLETLARFGIGRERVLETIREPYLLCERLLHHDIRHGIELTMHRFVPQWLKHAWPPREPVGAPLKLYLGRSPEARHGVANEDELRSLLEAAGFDCVVVEELSVAEQAALLGRAEALVAPHGGALTDMVFCRPGIPVVELLSRHVCPRYYGLAAMCGHRYHAILENPLEDYGRLVSPRIARAHAATGFQRRARDVAFDVPLDALERMLARLW